MYAFRRDLLGPALRNLTPDNSQGEYYLTDVVGGLAGMGHRIGCRAGARRRDAGRQRPLAARRSPSASCAPARTAAGCSTASRCSTRARRSSTSPCSSDATSRSTPARSSRVSTVIGDGCEIGPDTRLVDCVVGADEHGRTHRRREAEVGDGRRRRVRSPTSGRDRRSLGDVTPARSTLHARELRRPSPRELTGRAARWRR